MAANQPSPNTERSALLPTTHPEGARSLPCFGPSCSCLFPLASFQRAGAFFELNNDDATPEDEGIGCKALPDEKDPIWAWAVQAAKYVVSLALLGMCVGLCTTGIVYRQTPMAAGVRPALTIVLMWALVWWLGILEGAQGCLVGLQPVDPERFRASHPRTYACARLAHRCDNLNRFIVGRQFLVVLVVFLLNLVCTAFEDSRVPGIPPALMSGLVSSGLAVMIVTVMLGQLSAEVNATNCMFDFVDSRVVWVTTVTCLAIEGSGLLHAVYLIQGLFGAEGAGGDGERSLWERVWHWARMAASVVLLAAALVVTCDALWHDETTMVPGPSTVASFAVFFGLVCFLGILEAIQIAAFAVVKLPPHVMAAYPAAEANCKLVFAGRNFKAVLIGRQILVTASMFFLARITTTSVDPKDLAGTSTTMSTVLGIPPAVQVFFNTGLPGALITTIVASLWWRIAAASFPIAFMASPIVRCTVRLCLCLEATGVFSAVWLLADGMRWAMGIRPDDEHLESEKAGDGDLECGEGDADPADELDASLKGEAITILTKTSSGSDSIGSDASLTDGPDEPDELSISDGDTIQSDWLMGNLRELDCADVESAR